MGLGGGCAQGVFGVGQADAHVVGRSCGPGASVFGDLVQDVLAQVLDLSWCEVVEQAGAGAVLLVEEREQQVFGADAVVAEQGGLAQALFEYVFGVRGERQVPGDDFRVRWVRGAVRKPTGEVFGPDAEQVQRVCRDAVVLAEQTHQQVFGAEVILVAGAGFVAGEDDDPSCVVGEFFEHRCSLRRDRADVTCGPFQCPG